MLFSFFGRDSAAPAQRTCPFQGSWAWSHVGVSNWPLRLQPSGLREAVALVCANSSFIYALAEGMCSAPLWPAVPNAGSTAGSQRAGVSSLGERAAACELQPPGTGWC